MDYLSKHNLPQWRKAFTNIVNLADLVHIEIPMIKKFTKTLFVLEELAQKSINRQFTKKISNDYVVYLKEESDILFTGSGEKLTKIKFKKLGLICLNPSYVFKRIFNLKPRSLILTSDKFLSTD